MNCEHATSLMGDYLALDLSPEDQASFERHLTLCADCPALLKSYKSTLRVVRSLHDGDLSYERMSRIRRALHDQMQTASVYH